MESEDRGSSGHRWQSHRELDSLICSMRFVEQQDGEAGLGGGAVETLKCNSKRGEYEYVGEGGADDRAIDSNRTVRRTVVRRWVQDVRASLRGRPLFALFTVVNLVNYMDRGVRSKMAEDNASAVLLTSSKPSLVQTIMQRTHHGCS